MVRAADPDAKNIKGSAEPRLWTKPLRELTPETSLGFHVIEFAEEFLGVHLMPWQKWLLIHMFEMNEDGSLRFRTVIIEVARQNGKSLIAQIICLYRLIVQNTRMVLGTAQNLDIAREIWLSAVDLLENSEIAEVVHRVQRSNGKEELVLNIGGRKARWKVAAATRKGGRGLSVETVLMDELREQQTWEAWGAIKNTTMARADGLTVGISNAGDASSVVLKTMREKAIEAIDDGGTLAIFEWSAHEDADIDNVLEWARANPALGYTVTLETLIDARSGDEATFKTENLCQWVDKIAESYINKEIWKVLADPGSQIDVDSDIEIAVDVSADRGWTAVGAAGYRDDGDEHVEVIAYREGMFWAVDYVKQVLEALGKNEVVIQARGCAASELIVAFEKEKIKVRQIQGSELGFATGQFKDKVRDGKIRHLDQPALNTAIAGGLTKQLGEAAVWDRNKSMSDVCPLVAVSWALFALGYKPAPEEVKKSAYSDMEDDWWVEAREKTAAAMSAPSRQRDWWND